MPPRPQQSPDLRRIEETLSGIAWSLFIISMKMPTPSDLPPDAVARITAATEKLNASNETLAAAVKRAEASIPKQ